MVKRTEPLLSIIVPVRNEEKNISIALQKIQKYVKSPHEILVIYDLPEDTTVPVVKKLIHQNKKIKLIKNIYTPGIINAVKTGFSKANGDFLVVMSPDLADSPQTIQAMYTTMTKNFDIVGATRYAKGGKRLEQLSFKSVLSFLAGVTTPLFLGIPLTDLTNGFKMYRKNVLRSISIQSSGGWEFTMELIIKAKHKGYRITEVPTISRKRIYGKSKFKLGSWLPRYITWYIYGIKERIFAFTKNTLDETP